MTCVHVRERLTEFALGSLRGADAVEVERHLEWCAGCRKEAAELQEGAAAAGFALPEAEPPSHLERAIVERIATAAGRRKPRSRRAVFVLAAATFAAMLVAVGSFGWAVAERARVQDSQTTIAEQRERIHDFQAALDSFRDGNVPSQLQAALVPLMDMRGGGRLDIYPTPGDTYTILASATLDGATPGNYTIKVTDRNGRALAGGPLIRTESGVLLYYEFSGKNLARSETVTVADPAGRPVLTGVIRQNPSR